MSAVTELGAQLAGIISDTVSSTTSLEHDASIAARQLGVALDTVADRDAVVEAVLSALSPFILEQLEWANESDA